MFDDDPHAAFQEPFSHACFILEDDDEDDQARQPESAPFQARQGDVLLIGVPEIPDTATPLPLQEHGRVVLALGEATGHAHAVYGGDAALLADDDDARYLRLRAAASLDHEEHRTVALPSGSFRVIIQREYVPAELAVSIQDGDTEPGWRRVAD